ncbi:MAG: endonuclease/exonuclease/phosphatase family protein [Bradymonadaceae bacterium]|nr:endonuclease/exonuclease/phosphatase family protein [Lujinxingiaceae bacterium]
MKRSLETTLLALLGLAFAACSSPAPGEADKDVAPVTPDVAQVGEDAGEDVVQAAPVELRVASFNTSLFRPAAGKLIEDLETGTDPHALAIARILQRVRPDVVLLNEFDYDAEGVAASTFREKFLAKSQADGLAPLEYPHFYVVPSNTGVHSGFDLNNDGQTVSTPGMQSYGDDAFGFGVFEGQYAFVIFSKYPIERAQARSFQKLLWRDMPGNAMPEGWYSEQEQAVFRLSSKNHIDLPINVDGRMLHILAAHPTPPAFDGAEQRNVRRNNDEVRLWLDYITPGQADYIRDDAGVEGGLAADARFVIVGDLNTDPIDSGVMGAMAALLASPKTNDTLPESEGAVEKSALDARANLQHKSPAKHDTADFSDATVGNLRVDFALPSANVEALGSGVFWPKSGEPGYNWTRASDHHLVWVDLRIE